MITAIIVEDEAIAARKLQKLCSEFEIKVLTVCKSNAELKAHLDAHDEPQLYFMDIHLNDGIIFEFLQDHTLKSPIIFTTAYDAYAIKAFKQNSIDYLLKPIDRAELQTAMEKFSTIHQKSNSIDAQLLSQLLLQSEAQNFRERIKIKIGDRIKSIQITDIAFFFSKDKITFAHTTENRSYPIDYSLDNIFAELNPRTFFKVNRAYVISIQNIEDIISFSNSRLKVDMKTPAKHEIIVARERVAKFKEWLG